MVSQSESAEAADAAVRVAYILHGFIHLCMGMFGGLINKNYVSSVASLSHVKFKLKETNIAVFSHRKATIHPPSPRRSKTNKTNKQNINERRENKATMFRIDLLLQGKVSDSYKEGKRNRKR